LAGTIGYGTAFVNSGAEVACALKPLEKAALSGHLMPPRRVF
jgi:hypothetical protein